MKDSSWKITFTEKVSAIYILGVYGAIRGSLREIGNLIKWMERVFLFGLIREDTKAAIRKIKKKVLVFLNGIYDILL
jgi:bifunctional ADP-heptose synthase (sugar kinase/adenylyltransferase)